jgi:uncharacterized delta-60 repeat protein
MRVTGRTHARRRFVPLGAGLAAFAVAVGVAGAAPGKLDGTFGTGGVVTTAISIGNASDFVNGVAIQGDGRIVVSGSAWLGADQGGWRFALSRYDKHGSLDPAFGTNGIVTTDIDPDATGESPFGSLAEHIWRIGLQPDGKIVAAGEADMGAGAGGLNFALARYNPDGSLDSSFAGDGTITPAIAPGDNSDSDTALVLQSDGKIVAAGWANRGAGAGGRDFAVARFQPDGSADPTFGDGGTVFTSIAAGDGLDAIQGADLQSDGKIVVGGVADMGVANGGRNFAVARYDVNGDLDPTFGSNGIVTTAVSVGSFNEAVIDLVVQDDGKIVAGGSARMSPTTFDFALVRYNPDGTLDSSFGTGGIVRTDLGSNVDFLFDITLQADGKIVAVGQTGPTFGAADFAVVRHNPDGTLDTAFGDGGIVKTSVGSGYDAAFAAEMQKNDKIVVGGECEVAGTGLDVCVARYKAGPE